MRVEIDRLWIEVELVKAVADNNEVRDMGYL
jgi:hypothetical protein